MGQVQRIMASGRKELGSQTYDQHLEELIEADEITANTRRAALSTTPHANVPPPKNATVSYSRKGPGKVISK